MESLAILWVIALLLSLLCHAIIRHYKVAVFIATGLSSVAFQIFAYLDLGYIDPFLLVSFLGTSVHAIILAALVGLPFRAHRRSRSSAA